MYDSAPDRPSTRPESGDFGNKTESHVSSHLRNSNRPVTAFIPARYARASASGYEHSRRSAAPAAIGLTLAMFLSTGAVLAAAVQNGWIPLIIPPREGVHSIQLSASIASAPADAQHVVVIKPLVQQTSGNPAGAGQPQIAPRRVSNVGRSAVNGLPIEAPARKEVAVGGLSAPQIHRAETPQQPQVESKSKPPKRVATRMQPAATPAVAAAPSRAQEGVRKTAPRPIDNPQPIFPPELLSRQIEGVVVVKATVTGDGRVIAVRLHKTSGYDAFDRSAMLAVKRWRFNAADHVAADSTVNVNVPLRFSIER